MYNSVEHLIFYMIILSSFDVWIKKFSSHDFHTWKIKMELCCITSVFGITCQEAYCFNDVEKGQIVLEIFVLVR